MDHGSADGASAEPASALIGRALDAYRRLGEVGEEIADEWQYVTDLVAVHSAELQSLADAGPDRLLPPAVVAAVDAAIHEIGLIADPHRAIDWLSTFPQIVHVAVPPPVAGG